MIAKAKDWINKPLIKQGLIYLLKAIILIASLYLVAKAAPSLHLWLLLIVMFAYAVISMVGTLHFVVMRRMLRRYKLRESGDLAKLNQRWPVYTAVLFILSFFSAVVFILQAPSWSEAEWGLLLFSILLYYLVFLAAFALSKRQLADGFDKASAMKWAFWVTGIFLCVIYIFLFGPAPTEGYITMATAFDQATTPFADSPSALLSDLDSFTSFLDGLEIYASHYASEMYAWAGRIIDAVMFAMIFFGMSSQFCFCMLNAEEVKAEFQKLPPADEKAEGERPFLKRYFIIIAALTVVLCALLAVTEHFAGESQLHGEQAFIESQVEQRKRELVFLYDTQVELSTTRSEMSRTLAPLLEGYYAKCKSNVDAYVEEHKVPEKAWFENIRDWFASFFTAQENEVEDVRKEFIDRISDGANAEGIAQSYGEYRALLVSQNSIASEEATELLGMPLAGIDLPETLDLWQSLSDDKIRETLLNGEMSSDELKDRIIDLIDCAHQDALITIEVAAKNTESDPENDSE